MSRAPIRIMVVSLAAIAVVLLAVGALFPPRRLTSVRMDHPGRLADGSTAIAIPDSLVDIIGRGCGDCHSNTTRWPWYAAVAPANLVLASHVRRGREEFMLPDWAGTARSGRTAWMNLGASCYDVRNRVMPPRSYVALHPESRWTPREIEAFCVWAERMRDSLKAASIGRTCDHEAVRDALEHVVRRMHSRNRVPAISVAAVAPGLFEGVVTYASGSRSLGSRDSISPGDRFLAGSVGKMFFAALALRRASEGRLPLDAPVQALLPSTGIPAFTWISPRMLLTHTSGIGEYDRAFMESLIADPLRERDVRDWLGVLRRHPPARQDTGSFRYSDLNYVVLALVLDRIGPPGVYASIEREILTPLRLSATTPSTTRQLAGLLPGYDGSRSIFGQDAMMRDGVLIYNPQFEFGGGGFASTPADLARFMVAFRRGELFPDSLWPQVRMRPASVDRAARRWRGIGVDVDSTDRGVTFGHSGYMPGYVSWVRWNESHRVAAAMQVNATDPQRLVDDGYAWLDTMTVAVARRCTSPPPGRN